jgi:hypothetical protein
MTLAGIGWDEDVPNELVGVLVGKVKDAGGSTDRCQYGEQPPNDV